MPDFVVSTNIAEFQKAMNRTEQQLTRANRDAAEALGKEAAKLYKSTVSTWNSQPEFTVEVNGTSDRIEVLAGTDDRIYKFVDEGTRVRRAIMSPDWVSKTTPGSLKSGKGRGRVVFISKNVNRPGIKARRFTETIKGRIERMTEQIFNRYIKRAIRG